MNITPESLANDLDKAAATLGSRLRSRLLATPDAQNAFEYWQECFTAARKYTDAAFIQTKSDNALCELKPHLH